MNIIINHSSSQPIYEQIVSQIKRDIVSGELKPETPLPSVRTLAKTLMISALTVKKSYDALEQEGFVVTVHGKGSFVASTGRNVLQEERHKEVENLLDDAIRKGRLCGMTDVELKELFQLILEET